MKVGSLLDDIERHLLSVARRGAGQQRTQCPNRLAIPPNDSSDIRLPHLETKDREAIVRNFREHHFIRKFDEMPNDEFEELSHASDLSQRPARVQCSRDR